MEKVNGNGETQKDEGGHSRLVGLVENIVNQIVQHQQPALSLVKVEQEEHTT